MLLLLLLPFCPAQDAPPDAKTLTEWCRQIDDPDPAVRKAAFDNLNQCKDTPTVNRLRKTLQNLGAAWSKKAVAERTRALRALAAANRKSLKPQVLAARQKELLALLDAGDTGKMQSIVKELWSAFYFDPAKAEGNEKTAEAVQRIKELNGFIRAAGDEKEDLEKKLADAFFAADESQIISLMGDKDQKTMRGNQALRAQAPPEEYALIFITNQYRVLLGKNAVTINVKLCAAAREHSKDMKENDFFSHDSPLPGKATFTDRAARHGTSASAENIYVGSPKAENAFWAWFLSLGHHRNMVRDTMQMGAGNHERFWTEMF